MRLPAQLAHLEFTQVVQNCAIGMLLLRIALQKYACMQTLRNRMQRLLNDHAKLRVWMQHGVCRAKLRFSCNLQLDAKITYRLLIRTAKTCTTPFVTEF